MILMYHKVHPNSLTDWWVEVNDFYRQMVEINHKKIVYLDDYDPSNSDQVVITFDGVYENILTFAAPILKKFNYPFELFVTSEYVGRNNDFDKSEPPANFATPEELKKLLKLGGRLQWHTKSHINMKNVSDLNTIKNELEIPSEIKNIDKNGFKWFAYPYGEFNEKTVKEVKKNFKGGLSCSQGNDQDISVLNRITVTNKTSLKKASVACIIASYNYGNFLIEAIESVLRQTILPDEILISDDCSSDDTEEIGLDYAKRYPDLIRYNRNEQNLGVVKHFNKAVKLINSDYVFFLGADNRILSNYVEECRKVLDSAENIAIAYTDFALFGDRAKLAYEQFKKTYQNNAKGNFYMIKFPEFDPNQLETGNYIHGSSMYKISAFNSIDGYLSSEDTAEDYNLFLRMIKNGFVAKKTQNTLLEYRQHSRDQINEKLASYSKQLYYKRRIQELEKVIRQTHVIHLYKIITYQNKIKNAIKKYGISGTFRIIFVRLFKRNE
jgi:glycosyltransferase involved in cell wall biosynthesis